MPTLNVFQTNLSELKHIYLRLLYFSLNFRIDKESERKDGEDVISNNFVFILNMYL